MKTIFEASTRDEMIHRIERLEHNTNSIWGEMSVNQMICHITDPLRDFMGYRVIEPVTPPEMWPRILDMVMVDEDWQHSLPTFGPYSQATDGGGTKPSSFENDKQKLLILFQELANSPADFHYGKHAGLGTVSRDNIGKFIWKHTNHHLQQFGL